MFQFQLKKNQSSAKLSVGEVQGAPSPGATKYMKRFLSPTSTDRQPLHPGKEVSTAVCPLAFLHFDIDSCCDEYNKQECEGGLEITWSVLNFPLLSQFL